MVRIAINGFGRIGRMVLRAGIKNPDLEFVAVNDLTNKETLAHLFKYDSVHGTFDGEAYATEQGLFIDGRHIGVFSEKDPEQLPWSSMNIDIVVESTGLFVTKEGMEKHIRAGAKKVLLSAPAKGEGVKTIVLGVNDGDYNSEEDHLISNASCTTNCLAPIVKVLDDNFGVEQGFMTTTHAYTGDQRIQDAPHRDLRRARAAAVNIVPTSTGAAKAVTLVIPHLHGKLDGIALRVPVPCGSITDFVCTLKQDVSVEQINELMKNVAAHHMKNVLEYSEAPLVSTDILGNPHSSIFDSQLTKVNGRTVKVVSWYDNEWGYSNRVIDLLVRMMK